MPDGLVVWAGPECIVATDADGRFRTFGPVEGHAEYEQLRGELAAAGFEFYAVAWHCTPEEFRAERDAEASGG